jgi:hypothetical protein
MRATPPPPSSALAILNVGERGEGEEIYAILPPYTSSSASSQSSAGIVAEICEERLSFGLTPGDFIRRWKETNCADTHVDVDAAATRQQRRQVRRRQYHHRQARVRDHQRDDSISVLFPREGNVACARDCECCLVNDADADDDDDVDVGVNDTERDNHQAMSGGSGDIRRLSWTNESQLVSPASRSGPIRYANADVGDGQGQPVSQRAQVICVDNARIVMDSQDIVESMSVACNALRKRTELLARKRDELIRHASALEEFNKRDDDAEQEIDDGGMKMVLDAIHMQISTDDVYLRTNITPILNQLHATIDDIARL